MRLVNMDVDRYGTRDRCQLGPFSPGLNAICGPCGSGKTTLLSWLRAIAEENFGQAYAQPDPAWSRTPLPISGTVEIRNQEVDFRVTSDQTGAVVLNTALPGDLEYDRWGYRQRRNGRRIWEPMTNAGHITAAQQSAFAGLAAASGQADTKAALEQLAARLGIDVYDVAPVERPASWKARELELETRLGRIRKPQTTREALWTRRQQLESELQAIRAPGGSREVTAQSWAWGDRTRLEERCVAMESDLQTTSRQISDLDRTLEEKTKQLQGLGALPVEIGSSYREQLQQLEDRLNRWRQTLRDLKQHRETIDHNATDARLDKQMGDQLSLTKESDPRVAMRSLEAQILKTRSQLDALVDRYANVPGYDYHTASAALSGHAGYHTAAPEGVYRDASGRTYIESAGELPHAGNLPQMLRGMQRDLQEVCQQLARQEAKAATETLKQQATQLRRCESELLQSVEKLIEERGNLLNKIADEHHLSVEQLTLAFGQWCQCHDHPHLQDWLLNEETAPVAPREATAATRQHLIEEIESLKQTRQQAVLRAEDCRRQLRDAAAHRLGSVASPAPAGREVEIRRELEQTDADLSDLADRDRLEAELEQLRRSSSPPGARSRGRHGELVNQHIVALMPSHWQHAPASPDFLRNATGAWRREVPDAIVRLAMRLAIGEAMLLRGDPVSLILDGTIDHLPAEIQQTVVRHLAAVASQQQQIIVLTSDQSVTELVRNHHGWIGYLSSPADELRHDPDVNRHLSALANDEEADKWYHAPVRPYEYRRGRAGYYLQEDSFIEDLPALEATTAARCRALGVDTVGDLLDVDARWLAERLRVDGLDYRTVLSWQAKARLLCGVRHLRPFDARVLVGAGVRSPAQLADMHPGYLLDRVERFLATERGRRILRSGNSYELSRITSWIAAAKSGSKRYERTRMQDEIDGFHESDTTSSRRRLAARSELNAMHGVYDGYEAEYDADGEGARDGRYSANGEARYGWENAAIEAIESPACSHLSSQWCVTP